MKKSNAFKVSCIFAVLNVIVLAVYAIHCLMNSYIIPELLVFLTAASLMLSLLFILIKKIPDKIKAVITGLIFVLFSICFIFFGVFAGSTEFRKFDGIDEINSLPIETEDIGDFNDISAYKYFSAGIFSDLAYTTIAKYNEKAFEEQKNRIENEYEFYDIDPADEKPVPPFAVYGFEFRITDNASETLEYPKELLLIGINENTKEIAYIDFTNYDLDSISDYTDFVKFTCGWQHIF